MDSENERIKRQQQDFDDLQNEISGAETGRIRRFLTNDVSTPEGQRKKRERDAFESQLLSLLLDPVYRAKYDETMNALQDAEQRTEAALNRLNQMILDETRSLEDMEKRAARLPDGTQVFKDEKGSVRTADGQAIEGYLVDTILWSGDEPDFETYQQQHQKLDHLRQTLRATEFYRDDVLGNARDRMSDEDNPPDMDELDQILRDIEDKMPKAVQDIQPAAENVSPDVEASANVTLPSLG